nr:MAG TPA: hypothetical protein [Caudoviricetes sp.]
MHYLIFINKFVNFPSPIFNDSVRGIFLQLCVCQDIKNVL